MLKDTLNKYQWRQMRRKKDPFLVFDTHVPFSETQIQLLKNEGFGIHHTGVPGHLGMVTISPQPQYNKPKVSAWIVEHYAVAIT